MSNQPACAFRAYCFLVSCAALTYSISIQAINRLFSAVFYKYRCLLTWRTHWILIILSWFLCIIVPIGPFFIDHSFILVVEIRICSLSSKAFTASIYANTSIAFIPAVIITSSYIKIFNHVHQSTRRVAAFTLTMNTTNMINAKNNVPNLKRDLKVARNIVTQMTLSAFGATPFSIVILWNAIPGQSPPEWIYFLYFTSINLSIILITIYLFLISKDIKTVTFNYIRRQQRIQ